MEPYIASTWDDLTDKLNFYRILFLFDDKRNVSQQWVRGFGEMKVILYIDGQRSDIKLKIDCAVRMINEAMLEALKEMSKKVESVTKKVKTSKPKEDTNDLINPTPAYQFFEEQPHRWIATEYGAMAARAQEFQRVYYTTPTPLTYFPSPYLRPRNSE